jgi:hypothetical protein
MLTQLNAPQAHGEPIDKKMVKKMVDFYRSNRRFDGNCLKFAHFPLKELMKLFADNGIIKPLSKAQKKKIEPYGLKMYMANHANDMSTCPGGRKDYINKDTIILCNTQSLVQPKGYKTWVDMLDDNKWIDNSGASSIEKGEGLDKTTICPPDCPSATNHDNMDISSIS